VLHMLWKIVGFKLLRHADVAVETTVFPPKKSASSAWHFVRQQISVNSAESI